MFNKVKLFKFHVSCSFTLEIFDSKITPRVIYEELLDPPPPLEKGDLEG